MTFREKWEQDHPGRKFNPYIPPCPFNYGYEDNPENKPRLHLGMTCPQCWDSEIPEAAAITGLIDGLNDVEQLAKEAKTKADEFLGIKDSGSTTEFDTGAHRDAREGKGRCDLLVLEVVRDLMTNPRSKEIIDSINEFQKTNDTTYLTHCLIEFASTYQSDSLLGSVCTMCLEVAKHYEAGAKKYGENNWKRGMPTHIYIDSALRHYLKFLRGDTDEKHDSAFVWNIMCCIWEVDYSPRTKENA